jgi:hypothetical protein
MNRIRIPPILRDIVQGGIAACDGIVFTGREACPLCGGKVSGYDTKKKQFAVIRENEGLKPVHVFIRRYACHECHAVCYADEPFYPDTRVGSPLVDLCRTLGETMPYNRVAVHMLHLGIIIDRGTVRNFRKRPFQPFPLPDLFGIHLPLSVLSLSDLATRFGGVPSRAEALAACGFPSVCGQRLIVCFRWIRDKRDKEKRRTADRASIAPA